MEWSMYSFIQKWSASICSGLGSATGFKDARRNKSDKNPAVMELTDFQTSPTEYVGGHKKGRGRCYGSTPETSNPDVWEEIRSQLRSESPGKEKGSNSSDPEALCSVNALKRRRTWQKSEPERLVGLESWLWWENDEIWIIGSSIRREKFPCIKIGF